MNQQQRSLWSRLEQFQFDAPGTEFTFARRLARENGWSAGFAVRVIEEYKRFVFLAMAAGHPVTPSDEVDQAWHLHLTYTRSYWDKLCGECLEAPLHHDPTQGGAAEGEKFHHWYAKTLESYERFFGQPAPPDIWPDAQQRFATGLIQRVNSQRSWILPKPRFDRPALFVPLGALLVVPLFAATDFTVAVVIIFAVIVVIAGHIALVVYLARVSPQQGKSKRKGKWFGGGGGTGCGASGCGNDGCGGGGCGGGGCGGCGGG